MNAIELHLMYKNELAKYTPEQLHRIPKEGVWAIGQMYDHLIIVAHEYLDSMQACAALNEEQTVGKTRRGEKLFMDGGFPPIKIRLPDEMNAPPNNTDSKEMLAERMDGVIGRLEQWEMKVDSINPNFKMQHGGFGWLNAKEWFDLVEMHSRHHLRQKVELESYL